MTRHSIEYCGWLDTTGRAAPNVARPYGRRCRRQCVTISDSGHSACIRRGGLLMQTLALVVAGGHTSSGTGIGGLVVLLLILWLLFR
jgi:hypothetical protein